jgi:hypothetical protein
MRVLKKLEVKMSKRFTETLKWADPWFRRLPPKMKIFWLYVLDNCDAAGVWNVDMDLASFMIGEKFNRDDVFKALGTRIEVLPNPSYWFIPRFIEFQYKAIREDYNPHTKIYESLRKHNLISRIEQGLVKGWSTLMDKDKDKESLLLREDRGVEEGEIIQQGEIVFSVEDVIELWNSMAHANLPRVKLLAKTREIHVKARLQSFPHRHQWEHLIERVNASPFLTGLGAEWKCNFDWIMNPSNMAKILEGNYDDAGNRHNRNRSGFAAR